MTCSFPSRAQAVVRLSSFLPCFHLRSKKWLNKCKGPSRSSIGMIVVPYRYLVRDRHPGVSDYTIRAKVTEGLNLADSANGVAESFQSGGTLGFNAAALSHGTPSHTVQVVQTITWLVGLSSPSIHHAPLQRDCEPQLAVGNLCCFRPTLLVRRWDLPQACQALDWACTSLGNTTATAQSMAATAGALPTKYVHNGCPK